jgi:hypothetical protein
VKRTSQKANLKLRMQNFIFLVAPRYIQLDLHTDELLLLMFRMMQNHNRPPFMYEVQWMVDTDKTIALHPSMLLGGHNELTSG